MKKFFTVFLSAILSFCMLFAFSGCTPSGEIYLLKETYEKLIGESGSRNIRLLDFMLPDKLNEYFCAADLFVHPSSTETWGLVINEAMAKGCPVIATDRCVGAAELIRNGKEGFLTAVGDESDLRDKMLTVLDDESLHGEMSANAIERIRPYTYERLADTHEKLLEKLRKDER